MSKITALPKENKLKLSVFKGIAKRQGRGAVSGIHRTVMTSHTIANDF